MATIRKTKDTTNNSEANENWGFLLTQKNFNLKNVKV